MKSLQSRLLLREKGLFHIFTTRQGGKSETPYQTLNVARHVGDDEKSVRLNHAILAKKVKYDLDTLVYMRQIHSDRVVVIDSAHDFSHPPECDAIVTDIPDRPLMVMTADCTPLLLYDPRKRVIAAVHAGREGAFKNIAAKTVETMQKDFGSDPADILASMGPSIGKCCYEVGEELREEALKHSLEYAVDCREGHFFLDINAILGKQLHNAGVSLRHIENIRRCSACENDLFFSYRADGGETGRMSGVIMLSTLPSGA